MVPRSDEKKTAPLVPHYESKDWTSCYPIRQIYIKDARSLIADKLMEKDCLLRLIDAGSFHPPDMIGHIQPDFTLAVNRSRRKPFHWAFTLLPLPEDANETAVREEIRAWISKAIVYYYLGGKLDRISLIVDDEQIYSYALEEISTLHIKDEISVICISFLNRKILREYTLPVNSEKGNKTVPDLI